MPYPQSEPQTNDEYKFRTETEETVRLSTPRIPITNLSLQSVMEIIGILETAKACVIQQAIDKLNEDE